MAGAINGKDKEAEELASLHIHNELVKKLFKFLNAERETQTNHDIFNKVSVVALLKVASVMAVDSQIDVERFAKICELNFIEAHQHAPRWA